MKRLAILVLLGAAAGSAAAEPVAITGAKVHVKPGTVIDNATVVVDGGKVVSVTAGGAAPSGARVIDGKGKVVTAGFIESVSGVGLVAIDLESASVDGRFGAKDPVHDDPIHAAYDARDGFDAAAAEVAVARSGGVTTVVAVPFGGLIGGQSVAWTLDGAGTPARAGAGMHAALGGGGGAGSRGRAIELLREVLDDARLYGRDRAAYERNQRRTMIADRLDLEALQPVLRGTMPLVVEAISEADVRAALRLAADLRLRLVIYGATEAWHLAPELARAKAPVILDPTDNLPRLEANDVRDDLATVLAKAGVPVAISTFADSHQSRNIRQLAGIAVQYGMTWDQGLASVTTVPAQIYGLTGRGTVEKGAIADLVVWSGDPLELDSAAETVIIGGVVQSKASHQTRLLDRYRKLLK